ncbi:hypothetical protein QDR66_03175 [Acinetobacter baumannii]|uniref:hypothetical protein n=1 Tax=Acinetobacter baumannii TaxID=470 RepID=UPI00244B0B60|nr:hypothetical protein [Acinetobacter baumannii]MDH2539532.1 hypothetical protein [Acinetobacter baumannii]
MTDLNKERELCNQSFEKYWDDFCEAYGNGFDRSLAKLFFANAWGEAKAQAVLDTQQKLTDTYYLEGSDYVVDCPFEYDIEIDKGEVLELQKWQRTESTKVYFANIYKDEDNFEILQFASKAEAENAVAENLKFLEVSESGAEG